MRSAIRSLMNIFRWSSNTKGKVKVLCVMLSIGIACTVTSSASGQSKNIPKAAPFSLKISAPKSTVKLGSYVFITITQKNTSNHPVDCSSWDTGSTDLSYEYDIKYHGKLLKARPGAYSFPGSWAPCTLDPGKTRSGQYWISWLYDFSKPGAYKIRVLRRVSNSRADGVVESNTIMITVTAKP